MKVRPANKSNPCMIFLSGIPNSLMLFLAHLPRLRVTETPTNFKHDKGKTVESLFRASFHCPFFSKSSPTSHLQLLCDVEPGGALLSAGQGVQSTEEVSFLKKSAGHILHWVPEPLLGYWMLFVILLQSSCTQLFSDWSSVEQTSIQRDAMTVKTFKAYWKNAPNSNFITWFTEPAQFVKIYFMYNL